MICREAVPEYCYLPQPFRSPVLSDDIVTQGTLQHMELDMLHCYLP